jgi:hypothetical protein
MESQSQQGIRKIQRTVLDLQVNNSYPDLSSIQACEGIKISPLQLQNGDLLE